MSAVRDRRSERWNGWLTLLLVLGVVLVANRVARRELAVRIDLSEDQLFAISDATRSTMDRLEDTLSVHAFFTGDLRSGTEAMQAAQLEAQLEEFRVLAGGRMTVDVRDPSISSQALNDASQHRIVPHATSYSHGTGVSEQEVWRGLLLRYRGRTEAIAWVTPWTFEGDFVGAVHRLLSDQRPRIGWFGEPFAPSGEDRVFGTFAQLRRHLGVRFDLEEVFDLDIGEPVSDEIQVLVVMRPKNLHPREVYAIDQFVQRGGKLIVLVDQARMRFDWVNNRPDVRAQHELRGDPIPRTGMEAMLLEWGAPVMPAHVWDAGSPGRRNWIVVGPGGKGFEEPIQSPAIVAVQADGLDDTFVPSSGLQELAMGWVQPIGKVNPPAGIERTDFVKSSPDSSQVPLIGVAVSQKDVIRARTETQHAMGQGQPQVLACLLEGKFKTPFHRGAPEPRDPLTAWSHDVPIQVTTEVVQSGTRSTQIVVFGDADWLRDAQDVTTSGNAIFNLGVSQITATNVALFDNVLDWLTGSEDLIRIRNRVPKDRPLRDFLQEELESEGLVNAPIERTQAELRQRAEKREGAEARAARQRWLTMAIPVGVSLLLLIGFGLLWNLLQRRSA
tara:strand:- start:2195 stop:4033 length:1839 start_codon:yes stop_codon:yes gene_type:complete